MAQKKLTLTESQLNEFVTNVVSKMIKETNEYMSQSPIMDNIVSALAADLPFTVEPGENMRDYDINEDYVICTFFVNTDAYVKSGREYGYLELPSDPEVVVRGEPSVESVMLEVNGENMEDDGTVGRALDEWLRTGKIKVDYSDMELFPSENEYFTED